MMRSWRGFRLCRRVVRISRWLARGRSKGYHPLVPGRLLSSRRRNSMAVTKKLIDWCRSCLTRRPSFGSVALLGEEDGGASKPPLPSRAPKGHLVVYVGDWKERYVVPVINFNHPLFCELLREAEEEFGYHHPGGITIPCAVAHFERVQTRIAGAHHDS